MAGVVGNRHLCLEGEIVRWSKSPTIPNKPEPREQDGVRCGGEGLLCLDISSPFPGWSRSARCGGVGGQGGRRSACFPLSSAHTVHNDIISLDLIIERRGKRNNSSTHGQNSRARHSKKNQNRTFSHGGEGGTWACTLNLFKGEPH